MQATAARRVAKSIATICASFLLLSLFFVQLRYVGMTAGLLPVQKAEASVVARAPHFDGSGTVYVEYCSEVVAGHDADNPSGLTSTNLAFDDAWLERDSFAYQHQLATACSVLAAVCNSESQFYGGVEGAKPYAELALGALGFDDVRTDSYALRSGILDEIGALFAGSHDVAAYTLASKTVPGKKGEPPTTILFVGIRGSYGIEWLSNFNFMNPVDADHQGFKAAEREIEEALFDYARERGADPAHTRVLVTGHSRGGAIANLLAARLDNLDGSPQQLAPARNVFAYTFAAPCATKTPDRQAASYGNVFNIVNESDIVPQLPLSIWGYGRYGTNVVLPDASSATFAATLDDMQDAYRRNTGTEYRSNEGALASLVSFEAEAARNVPDVDSLASPAGIFGALQTLAGLDCMAAIDAHCPDTYIAWMQATDPGNLTFRSAHATAPGALQAVA